MAHFKPYDKNYRARRRIDGEDVYGHKIKAVPSNRNFSGQRLKHLDSTTYQNYHLSPPPGFLGQDFPSTSYIYQQQDLPPPPGFSCQEFSSTSFQWNNSHASRKKASQNSAAPSTVSNYTFRPMEPMEVSYEHSMGSKMKMPQRQLQASNSNSRVHKTSCSSEFSKDGRIWESESKPPQPNQPVDLIISNLDPAIHHNELQRLLTNMIKKYAMLPNSEEEWQQTGKDFENRWNFPNCGGAIDGKHIRIKKPPNSGSYFYNYKGFCSIVLMAIVNADYQFIYVNVGCNGRVSDGGVIECTGFYTKLLNKSLNLPPNSANKANLNFVFVADDAFALHENVLKPYPQRQLTYDQRIFNYRLSRARRIVENAFGILSSRFRIFHTEINLNPEKIDFIVLAACALHNFLRKEAKALYMPSNSLDVEDIDSGEVIRGDRVEDQLVGLRQGYNRQVLCENEKDNRDNYKNYFVGEGAVSWQNKFVIN